MRQAQIVGVPLGYREDMTHVSTTDLDRVLASLGPQPSGTYVFSLVDEIPQGVDFFAVIRDEDGYTVVVEQEIAREAGINADELYTRIDLGSSTELAAIGITASIAQILAARSITANFIACRRHDHLFVIALKRPALCSRILAVALRAGYPPEIHFSDTRTRIFGLK